MKKLLLICYLLNLLVCLSCKRKDGERPRWETDIVTPIVKTSIGIQNFMQDSSFQTNSDQTISLVHRQLLYTYGLDSLVGLEIKPFIRQKSLESLKLDPYTYEYKFTMGEMARRMEEDGNPAGALIRNSHGTTIPLLSVSGVSAGPVLLNINEYFNRAKIKTGELSMTIHNGFGVNLSNINLELRNYYSNNLVLQDNIPSLPRNSSQTMNHNLAGKEVEGYLRIDITSMTVGGGLVFIDTNAAITATISVKDVTVEEATAVFPAQDIIDDEQDSGLEEMGAVRLTKALIKGGKIKMSATTTTPDTIYFNYYIPAATLRGMPFHAQGKIPPAVNGTPVSKTLEFDVSGYELDLRGRDKDSFNVIHNRITARIEYTGKPVTFSLSDYVDVSLTFENIRPYYIQGFLGNDTIEVGPGEQSINLSDLPPHDRLDFKEVKLSLEIENGLGAKGDFVIDKVYGKKNTTVKTISSPAAGTVASAVANPFSPVSSTIPVISENPSPADIFNMDPEIVGYAGKVYLNKGVPNTDYSGFAYETSKLNAFLNVELPLNVMAENLRLTDTIDMPETSIKAPIKEGILSLLVWNGYPLEGSIKVKFLENDFSLVDSLVSGREILPAPVDPVSGRVKEKKYSKISFNMDINRLNKLLAADKAFVEIRLWSAPQNQFVKIYTDYKIDLKLSGDFNYTISTK